MMRLVDRFVGLVFGLGIAFGGLLVAVETVLGALDRPPWLVDTSRTAELAQGATWAAFTTVPVLLAVTATGVALSVFVLWPRGPRDLPLGNGPAGPARLERRGLERHLADLLDREVTVRRASARVRRRRVRLRVTGPRDADARAVRQELRERVRDELRRLGLRRVPRVSARLATGKARTR